MTYLSSRKSATWRRKRKLFTWAFIVGVVVVFIFLRFNVFSPISSFFHRLVVPIWKIENSVKDKFASYQFLIRSKKSLLEENELLQERLEEYRIDLLYKNILFDENQKLKEIFGRAEGEFILSDLSRVESREVEGLVLGVILSKPNRSPYDTLVIDVGKNRPAQTDENRGGGIKEGDLVFAEGNILIGQIEEVFRKSSKVSLFSTPGEKLDVVISGSDMYTTLTGRGGGNFEMTLPRDIEIEENTAVLFPSINSYLVARVEKINYDPRDPFQKILLISPVNIQHLKFVQVKTGSRF